MMTEEVLESKNEVSQPVGEAIPVKSLTSIFIGIPAYDGKVDVPCVGGLLNAIQILRNNNMLFDFRFEVGLPWLSMVRNSLARQFLESEHTDLVFIDSDLGFPPDGFQGLISCPEDLVSGVYPKKQDDECFAVNLETDDEGRPIVENGLLMAKGLPTGFMKIKRTVFEQIAAVHPELIYECPIYHKSTYNFFGMGVKEGKWVGDDYGFCDLWREIGGRCYVLPNITFQHRGHKNYQGNLHQHLLRPAQMGERREGGPAWIAKPSEA